MSGSSQVLREYLVSLGFKIDKQGGAGLDTTLMKLDKRALALGGSLLGVLAAAQAMTQSFAAQMESMYYSSRRIGTTVGNLRAMEQGATRVGITAETMRQTLEGMAMKLRMQPGLAEMLEGLGVPVTGRDKSDVLKDMVGMLKSLKSFPIAAQLANEFGMDANTLFQLTDQYDEFIAAEQRQRDILKSVGTDYEAAAKAGREYANMMRDIQNAAQTLTDTLLVKLMPVMKSWQEGISGGIITLAETINHPSLARGAAGEALADVREGARRLTSDPKGFLNRLPRALGLSSYNSDVNKRGWIDDAQDAYEAHFRLRPGTIDKVWKQESGRGKYMLSPAGAQGHMGFMPSTWKEWGNGGDPNNEADSKNAFARYFTYLLKRYAGDEQAAFAAYNWGLGNVDKQYTPGVGLTGKLPKETLGYLDAMGVPYSGGGVAQTNTFHIHGTDPKGTATAVRSELELANRDLIRNLNSKMR